MYIGRWGKCHDGASGQDYRQTVGSTDNIGADTDRQADSKQTHRPKDRPTDGRMHREYGLAGRREELVKYYQVVKADEEGGKDTDRD